MASLHPFLNRHTEHFLTIYEFGSIHAAAEQLGLTQPAVTMSLKQLEDQLETCLFNRSVKGMSPTPSGQTYYRFACSLRQSAQYASQEIKNLTTGYSGTLRIGAGVAWAVTIIPEILVEIGNMFPDLSIELITGVGDQLANSFEKGKLDILLAAGTQEPLNSPDFVHHFLRNISTVAVADSSHQLAKKKNISLEELASVKWAGFFEDDTFVHHATRLLAQHGLPAPTISMRTNSITALIQFVKNTGAVTLITEPLLNRAELEGLMPLSLEAPLWDIPISIHTRQHASELKPIRHFISLISEKVLAL